ncbi:MAG: CocE/NonD family hydrolase, partial [Perlucidibaca sp.]
MSIRHGLRLLGCSTLIACLSACGGGASDAGGSGSPNVIPGTTASVSTLGTRGETSQAYGASAGNAGAVWQDYDPPMLHEGMTTLPTQFITMRDGVKLAVSVTLPADASGQAVAGKFPVVLVQTSYNLSTGQYVAAIGGADPYIVRHGYATVVVDVRGTGNSQGTWDAFGEDEQADYGEVVDWVTSQAWSDGRIGLFGVSYLGITSVLTAELQKPAVKAAFPIVPIGDGYRDIVFTGGQVNPTFIPIWMGLVTGLGALDFGALQADPAMGLQTLVEHLVGALVGFQVPTILKALLGDEETAFDSDFWRIRSPLERARQINVPT